MTRSNTPREPPSPRWWQRLLQRIPSTAAGAWLFSRTLHHVDPVLLRLSNGRISIPEILAGLPTIRLTTVGAKTGKERTVPVLGLPDDGTWVVFATNWGGDRHPAWYHNLQANPEVEVTYGDRTETFVARDADEQERHAYWDRAKRLYVGFEAYRRRTDRRIPIVVLEPSDGTVPPGE
ncbi:MAG: nitroreductase family deazaflavin-dependent oxidoreductase [Haloarculaceae archaeon]